MIAAAVIYLASTATVVGMCVEGRGTARGPFALIALASALVSGLCLAVGAL